MDFPSLPVDVRQNPKQVVTTHGFPHGLSTLDVFGIQSNTAALQLRPVPAKPTTSFSGSLDLTKVTHFEGVSLFAAE